MGEYEKGDKFDQSSAPGFIHLFALPDKTQAKAQPLFDMTGENKSEG
jgi:argininosuccinate synthase